MQENNIVLTKAEKKQYDEDGYIIKPKMFSQTEIDKLFETAKSDNAIQSHTYGRADKDGNTTKLALWYSLDNNIYSAFARSERMAKSVELLLNGKPCHFHTKLMQKEPKVGGAWEWHQDYGYWYHDGFLYPDMISVMVALTPANRENGCLQVIKGSHKIGRIEHGKSGGQKGADLEIVEEALKRLELVYVELNPGDTLFFHCNLLHRSDKNSSDYPRWSMISTFNRQGNKPYKEQNPSCYTLIDMISDEKILEYSGGYIRTNKFYQMMTGAERLAKALNFTEADRVPLDLSGTTVSAFSKYAFDKAMEYKGFPVQYGARLIDPIQQIVIPGNELMERLNIDTHRIGARRIMNFEEKMKEDEAYLSIMDPYECEWRMKKEGDLYFNQASYPYQHYNSLGEALQDFSIYDIREYKATLTRDIEEQLANKGDRGLVLDRNCAGLTEMSLRIRGYDTWFMDTMIDPDGVKSLLDLLVDHKIAYWEVLAEILDEKGIMEQVQVVAEADDLGTQSSLLLSPDSLHDIVMPRIFRLMKFLKKRFPLAKTFFHTDGAVRQIIPDLIDAGVDILNPVQYSAEGMILKELKMEFGKDLVFWGGGIDTQEILNKATPAKVRDEVKRNIDVLAPGGGFVFTTVHNIQADVPPENFWAMWESVMEYGRYD